jgi:hypothetical protein
MDVGLRPPQRPKIEIDIVKPDSTKYLDDQNEIADIGSEYPTPEQQAVDPEVSVHSAIVRHLERMQTDLAALLSRWRRVAPGAFEPDDDDAEDAGVDD